LKASGNAGNIGVRIILKYVTGKYANNAYIELRIVTPTNTQNETAWFRVSSSVTFARAVVAAAVMRRPDGNTDAYDTRFEVRCEIAS
jgi:hypothetical protein